MAMENFVDDDDKTKEVLDPDETSCGGLHQTQRVAHGLVKRKSLLLGLDVLASAKRAGRLLKAPREMVASTVTTEDGSKTSGSRGSCKSRYDSSGIKTYGSGGISFYL
ncbi:hypothetical protein HanPI659440_Chr07g0275131 [Helianthus annuus]|nr:hypothetical protein HanPI659440_Chr07g0275131 [Helianthus annuus]